MSDNPKFTSKNDISELREKVNIRFKAARAEAQRAFDRMFDDCDQRAERNRIEYLLALGKQEAFESIMELIDNFLYSYGLLRV